MIAMNPSPPPPWPAADWSATSPAELLSSHLARPHSTAHAYAADLKSLRARLGVGSVEAAVQHVVELPRGAIYRMLTEWVGWHRHRGLSVATARRRIASTLALLRLAADCEIVTHSVRFKLPAARALREAGSVGRDAVERMIVASQQRGDKKGERDAALLSVAFYSALRSGELLNLELKHVDLERCEIQVLAKGRWTRAAVPFAHKARLALRRWVEVRGDQPGPLWLSMQPGRRGKATALSYRGWYEVVQQLAREVGLRDCHPHQLRHTAIEQIWVQSNGNLGWGMALSRHVSPTAFLGYTNFDHRQTMREAVELVAAGTYTRLGPDEGNG